MIQRTAHTDFQRKLRTSRIISLVLAVLLVVVGGAYGVLWSETQDSVSQQSAGSPEVDATPQSPDAPTSNDQAPAGPSIDDLASEPYMTLGEEDAPVTVYEWTDFTCPYCGLFHRDTLPQIIKEYVDTGKVKLVVHDVTFIGDQAENAAIAARAAGLQDRYFDYLFAMYALSADGANPNLDEAQLLSLAKDLKLDTKQFTSDVEGGTLRAEVQESTAKAHSFGVTGVPFFLVAESGNLEGIQSLSGAQPLETFKEVLDSTLKNLDN